MYTELNGRPLIVKPSEKFLNSSEGSASRNEQNEHVFKERDQRTRDRRDKRRSKAVDADAIAADFNSNISGSGSGSGSDSGSNERIDSNSFMSANADSAGFDSVQDQRFVRAKYSLYIGNISNKADITEISGRVAEAIGKRNIKKIRLSHDQSGGFRGFGHIDFFTEAQALDSVEALTGITINGRALNVNLAKRTGSTYMN